MSVHSVTAASGNSDVAQFEPRAYFGLGVVYERGYHDPRQAASYYERCIAAAGTDTGKIESCQSKFH